MDEFKTTYLRAIILLDDISSYHQSLNNENEWNEKLRLFKNCFVALDIFRDSLRIFSALLRENAALSNKARDLKRRLQFTNHVRNIISGHLAENLLEKAVQWEPCIFFDKTKDNESLQVSLVYKTLLESAINSFIDKESMQKVFSTKIDLLYPSNQRLFFNYIKELNSDSIYLLNEIVHILRNKITFLDEKQALLASVKAGETDFRLKE
jgi:hypothetical protein